MTDVPTHEIEAAKAWRFRRNLTMRELGELIGYSESKISWVERGLSPPRHGRWDGHSKTSKPTPVTPATWQRYRLLCSLVEYRLQYKIKSEFNW